MCLISVGSNYAFNGIGESWIADKCRFIYVVLKQNWTVYKADKLVAIVSVSLKKITRWQKTFCYTLYTHHKSCGAKHPCHVYGKNTELLSKLLIQP